VLLKSSDFSVTLEFFTKYTSPITSTFLLYMQTFLVKRYICTDPTMPLSAGDIATIVGVAVAAPPFFFYIWQGVSFIRRRLSRKLNEDEGKNPY